MDALETDFEELASRTLPNDIDVFENYKVSCKPQSNTHGGSCGRYKIETPADHCPPEREDLDVMMLDKASRKVNVTDTISARHGHQPTGSHRMRYRVLRRHRVTTLKSPISRYTRARRMSEDVRYLSAREAHSHRSQRQQQLALTPARSE